MKIFERMSSYGSNNVPKICMVFPLKSKGMTSRWPFKKKRTQGNKINVGVSKVPTNLGSLQISPAVPTSTLAVASINPSPTISIESHPKILRVDDKMTLTYNIIQQWIDSIRELSARSITFHNLTLIVEEGRFATDARMKQKFEDGHEWESWPMDKFLTNLLISHIFAKASLVM